MAAAMSETIKVPLRSIAKEASVRLFITIVFVCTPSYFVAHRVAQKKVHNIFLMKKAKQI